MDRSGNFIARSSFPFTMLLSSILTSDFPSKQSFGLDMTRGGFDQLDRDNGRHISLKILRLDLVLRCHDVRRHRQVLGHVLVLHRVVSVALRVLPVVRRVLLRIDLVRTVQELALYQPREFATLGTLTFLFYVNGRFIQRGPDEQN